MREKKFRRGGGCCGGYCIDCSNHSGSIDGVDVAVKMRMVVVIAVP